jgi:hypothetical protein
MIDLRLKEKKSPLVLTVNGRAELVVQDAASYQEMLDRLELRRPSPQSRKEWTRSSEARPFP